MAEPAAVQVSQLLDEGGIRAFHIRLIVWSVLIAFIDGYDITAIALAAPELVRAWGVERAALGPVLSASLIGILFGSMIFGWIGDRFGRKAALIGSLLVFGVFTWIAAYATNLNQMFWLRFLAGLGIGGVIPNMIALNIESAPRRSRATLALIAAGCVPFGGAIPGFVSAALVPQHGWPILFLIGGIVPIVIAVAAYFFMPESVKFMTIRERHRANLVRVLQEIKPGFQAPANARFVIEDEKQFPGFNPAYLFREGLALITPLLWLLFALNLMGYFFLLSWTPTLLRAANLPPATAALSSAAIQIGGTVGALLLVPWLNRRRFFAISILFVIAVPVVASLGYVGTASTMTALLIASFFAGFCVLGIQTGINVAGAMIYPTSLRANGSGWELGIGRLGSIVGPLLGGLFVALPVTQLYMWSAIPFALGAVICFAIYRLNEARVRERPYLREG
ncbi:MAG TPA: MFS transporter [Burkholderiales bacterium]|nr:MFS transporter [Burkholderiales bacterium]